jgi:hypothetical protein
MNRAFDPIVSETFEAYQTMMANEDGLDEKVDTFIRAACKKDGTRLSRISRCGGWYLEEFGGKLVQCCIVRLYTRGESMRMQTMLREYAIRYDDLKGSVFEVLA